jgi:hypothetical protein
MLQEAVTRAATASGTEYKSRYLRKARELLITLNITAAERDSGNETYDIYVTCGDGISQWDLVHFPQIATTGAKTFTAIVTTGTTLPRTVTTAAPGVEAVNTGTMATQSGGANAIKSLTAGMVRHGAFGDRLNHELVVAGTVATGISYSIQVEAR